MELSRNALIHIANTRGELFIKQNKRLFSRFRKKPILELFVPEHLLPAIEVKGDDTHLSVTGGLYKSLDCYSDKGEINLNDAAFESVSLRGDDITFTAANLTVKGNIICEIKAGEAVLENCFATYTECRNKGGNVGVVNLNCKDALFEAEHGNVTASIIGDKQDYNLTLSAREGTCNLESDLGKPCTGALKAFTYMGNIFVEFITKSEEV
jgi:hypothetical protein